MFLMSHPSPRISAAKKQPLSSARSVPVTYRHRLAKAYIDICVYRVLPYTVR